MLRDEREVAERTGVRFADRPTYRGTSGGAHAQVVDASDPGEGTREAEKDPHHIVFGLDARFAPHVAASMASVLLAARGASFHFHLVHLGLPTTLLARMECTTELGDAVMTTHPVPASLAGRLPAAGTYPTSAWLRLTVPELLEGPHVTYLDGDTIVLDSIEDLRIVDPGSSGVAAARDPHVLASDVADMTDGAPYFNSGVMRMNLDTWRATALHERALAYAAGNDAPVPYADQTALNVVLEGAWHEIDPRFNVLVNAPRTPRGADADFAQRYRLAVRNPSIVHYAGPGSPAVFGRFVPYKRAYWRSRNATPYRRAIGEGPYHPLALAARIAWRLNQQGRLARRLPPYLRQYLQHRIRKR